MAANPEDVDLLIDRAVHAVRELNIPNGPRANVVDKVRLAGTTAVVRNTDSIERAQSASDPSASPAVPVGGFSLVGAKVVRPRKRDTTLLGASQDDHESNDGKVVARLQN